MRMLHGTSSILSIPDVGGVERSINKFYSHDHKCHCLIGVQGLYRFLIFTGEMTSK